jgi:hypothetical protein
MASGPSNTTTLIFTPGDYQPPPSESLERSDIGVHGKDKKKKKTLHLKEHGGMTRFLLYIWQERYPSLGGKKNATLWQEIAKYFNKECAMNGIKSIRSANQCKSKVEISQMSTKET